jgi:predicted subunit of tRNA(5-methylaminomethyl-2-thiouridylate) methyltransferase
LSRIADALERIANRPADRAIAAATRRQQQMQPVAPRESQSIPDRMFGK